MTFGTKTDRKHTRVCTLYTVSKSLSNNIFEATITNTAQMKPWMLYSTNSSYLGYIKSVIIKTFNSIQIQFVITNVLA
jgi:hypothetical protein